MVDFLDHEGNRPHPNIVVAPSKAAAPSPAPAIIITLHEHWSGLFPTLVGPDGLVAEIAPYVEHQHWPYIWQLALELLGHVTGGTTQEHPAAWQVVAHAHREGWVSGGPTF